jgi:hypothetical protein
MLAATIVSSRGCEKNSLVGVPLGNKSRQGNWCFKHVRTCQQKGKTNVTLYSDASTLTKPFIAPKEGVRTPLFYLTKELRRLWKGAFP